MVKTAFLFPGQGSQFVGMGKDFYDSDTECRAMFDEACEVLGQDITDICFNGPEEVLKLTENTQPALLIHSSIALKRLKEHDIDFVMAAGHSLGEFSALVAVEALKFRDAVHLVRQRGRFMQEAVPVGVGGMAAIIGLPLEKIQELCNDISTNGKVVQPANLNSPEQIVIAGHKELVESVSESAVARNQVPMLTPTTLPIDSLVTAERPTGDRQSSPVVCNRYAKINQIIATCPASLGNCAPKTSTPNPRPA